MAHAHKLELTVTEKDYLLALTRQRTAQARVVDRAKILLYKTEGISNSAIATRLDVNTNTVNLCLNKYKHGGIQRALFDDPRSGRKVEITEDAVAWIFELASQPPAEMKSGQIFWTLTGLHTYIQRHAEAAGYPRLKTMTKTMLHKILNRSEMDSLQIRHYSEKEKFDQQNKLHDILLVSKPVIIPSETLSLRQTEYDSEPAELLAGIDLFTGQFSSIFSKFYKSTDLISLLKKLDDQYPEEDRIRILCDNHALHKEKAIQNYLATCPKERFAFSLKSTYSSWLPLFENFFGQITDQLLTGNTIPLKEEQTAYPFCKSTC